MRKFIGVVLLIIGNLGLLLSAVLIIKWAGGEYIVHEMTLDEFVAREPTMKEYSFIRLTGASLDLAKQTEVLIVVGGNTPRVWDVVVPIVGADRKPLDIVALLGPPTSSPSPLPAYDPASPTTRYWPVTINGNFSRGAGSRHYADSIPAAGVNPEHVIRVRFDSSPLSPIARIGTILLSILMFVAGIAVLKARPKTAT